VADRPAVAPDRVISVVDPDARHAHKTVHRRQDGFKAHVAVRARTPVWSPPADCPRPPAPTAATRRSGSTCSPTTRARAGAADSAYGSGAPGHADQPATTPIKPIRRGRPCRLHRRRLHHRPHRRHVTCPNGLTRDQPDGTGRSAACRLSLRRGAHPPSGGHVKAHEHDTAARRPAARARPTPSPQPNRQHRPMVERSIAWLVRGGNRKAPLPRHRANDLWLHHRLAGLNLRRLLNLGSPAARSLGTGLTVRRSAQTSRPALQTVP
jgi:hypothetical protein